MLVRVMSVKLTWKRMRSSLVPMVQPRFLHPRINLHSSRRWQRLTLYQLRTVGPELRRHPGHIAKTSGFSRNHFRSRHVAIGDRIFTGRSIVVAARSAILWVARTISGRESVAVRRACAVVDLQSSTSGHVVYAASNVGHIVSCSAV